MEASNATVSNEQDTALVVKMLPVIITSADRFQARAAAHVRYVDLLSSVDMLLTGVAMFAADEFTALDPNLIAGARQLEGTGHLGFVAMGRRLMLQVLAEHPEVMRLAAERATEALWDALCDESDLETIRDLVGT